MAMGKNKTGIMAAITAAAENSTDTHDRAQRTLPRGTIGSVRAGLGGIQDIDTSLVLPWGPKDRLDGELTDVNSDKAVKAVQELMDSIASAGQQVPILLRPSAEKDGYFEVIYGRRRIIACRQLGIPVKALIRTMGDAEALRAKGLENASRTELSYYERARFAQAIHEQGYSRTDICQALAISKNTLSQFERITRLIPTAVGDSIGIAPGAGRPKWMKLARAFEITHLDETSALNVLASYPPDISSDARLDALLKESSDHRTGAHNFEDRQPLEGVEIKSRQSSVTLFVVKSGGSEGFGNWLDHQLDALIMDAFERYQAENCKEEVGDGD